MRVTCAELLPSEVTSGRDASWPGKEQGSSGLVGRYRSWEMHGHVGAVALSFGAFGLASRPGYWARLEGQMGVHLLGLLWLDCNGPGSVLWL